MAPNKMHIKKYLTERAVLEIFAARPRPSPASGATPTKHERSRTLAKLYGVSISTVQQVWSRKCWAKLTEAHCEDWERTGSTSRSEDESSASDVDRSSTTRTVSTGHCLASDKQVDACDWFIGAFDSDACSMLDDIERLPGFYSENPFKVDWDCVLNNTVGTFSHERPTHGWKCEEVEAGCDWGQDGLQAELLVSAPLPPFE